MSKWRILLVFAWLAGIALLAADVAAEDIPRRPNVIVILSDDQGYGDIGVHGCQDIPTPNIDSLAKNGIRCAAGYVTAPQCTPSRAGLITGRYQQRFGYEVNSNQPESGLPPEEVTLAARMKAAGYVTGLVGKWHLGWQQRHHPMNRGFDEFFGFLGGANPYLPAEGQDSIPNILRGREPVKVTDYLTTVFGREAVSFVERHQKEPFFLYLAFNAPHVPLQAAPEYLNRFSSIPDPTRRTYAAMVSALDDAIGAVLAKLRQLKLEERTLVFFLSDNGGPAGAGWNGSSNAPWRGHKGAIQEGGIRVPFLVQWQGTLPAGKVYDQPVISLDVLPTALAAAGVTPQPEWKLDGVNLLPYLKGEITTPPHDLLFWRFTFRPGHPMWAIRQGDWKLESGGGSAETADPQPPASLFNLRTDPHEDQDLKSAEPDKARTLGGRWEAWNAELMPPRWGRDAQAAPSRPAPPTDGNSNQPSRPNVVMIIADDMNGYGFYGEHRGVRMPYLDRFKETALTFDRAYCASPACVPSRAAVFSGLYPHTTGSYRNGSAPWDKTLAAIESLPECFKRSGYATWGGGKLFHAPFPADREKLAWDNKPYGGGFGPFPPQKDQLLGNFWGWMPWEGPDSDFPDVKNAQDAIQFLQQDHDKPFFLMYGLWRPHTPFTAPKRFFEMYRLNDVKVPVPGWRPDDLDDVPALGQELARVWGERFDLCGAADPNRWRQFVHAYYACTSFADWSAGRVIETLDKSRYAGNTIVIFWSDNGYHCGEKNHWEKTTLWEQAALTPLAIRAPGLTAAGQRCPRPVNTIDLFPTLVDLCGLQAPNHKLEGASLRPLLQNPAAPWDRPAITTYGERYFSARDERYRYICYPDGSEELYDHQTDPHEFVNLADKPELAPVKQRFSKWIPQDWAKSLGGRLG